MKRKIIVGLDVDGVLRDLVGSIKRLYDKLGKPYDEVAEWELEKAFGKDVWDIIRRFPWEVFCGAGVYPGVLEMYDGLLKLGVEIWILTNQAPEAQFPTGVWLERWGFDDYSLRFDEAKESVNCDIYLDDGPPYIERPLKAGKRVVVRDRPWNRYITGVERVKTYGEFLDIVRSLCEKEA